jgi:hypothetical protein
MNGGGQGDLAAAIGIQNSVDPHTGGAGGSRCRYAHKSNKQDRRENQNKTPHTNASFLT